MKRARFRLTLSNPREYRCNQLVFDTTLTSYILDYATDQTRRAENRNQRKNPLKTSANQPFHMQFRRRSQKHFIRRNYVDMLFKHGAGKRIGVSTSKNSRS